MPQPPREPPDLDADRPRPSWIPQALLIVAIMALIAIALVSSH
ncbi:MAG TPA: hypothetical protein VII24_09585 [Pseudolabrys sp.]|jgi:hypothetical protein